MASPSTPTHGKRAAFYRMRPNGFKGSGLNDAAWGTGFAGAATAYYEVVIQSEATPDLFKWRKNGGAWTEDVAITGAAQTLDDSQTITFAATTGHTADDQWTIGNFKDEGTTESGDEAQITETTRRRINPNSPPTFTDDGGETVLTIDYSQGKAVFTGNVGVVDVDGNNGFVVLSGLQKMGYIMDWDFNASVKLDGIPRMGQEWDEFIVGLANAKGSANAYHIGSQSFYESMEDCADGTQNYWLLELYNYDPDQDQTGDRIYCWVSFESFGLNAPLNTTVKEKISFKIHGMPSFTANA